MPVVMARRVAARQSPVLANDAKVGGGTYTGIDEDICIYIYVVPPDSLYNKKREMWVW